MSRSRAERADAARSSHEAQRHGEEGRRPKPKRHASRRRRRPRRHPGAAAKPRKAAGVEAKTVAEFREALRKNLIKPSGMMLITRERIEEALEERQALTRRTPKGSPASLVKRGRKETNDVLKDLEELLDKGRRDVSKRAGSARGRAVRASPAIAQADRAPRRRGRRGSRSASTRTSTSARSRPGSAT